METENTLTAIDVAALRKANRLVVRLRNGKGTIEAIKENRPSEKDPFAQDVTHYVTGDVKLHKGTEDERARAECFEMAWLYPSQHCPASSILSLLKVGDSIAFWFCPDWHSTQGLARVGFHGDVLELHVTRGKKRLTFNFAVSICPDNSARMIKGLPVSERWLRDAATSAA